MFRQKFQLITSIINIIALVLLALYALSSSAWAQQPLSSLWGDSTVPLVMNYQGHVEDSAGNPLTGYYTMTIRIYDDVIATTALWEEEHASVTVREGYFDVLLGNTTPISDTLFNQPDRFIGVTVHPHDEMVPRQRFASVPYAMHSFHATKADHALEADHATQADHAYALNAPDGNPADAVYVDDEGRVGIGTTNPDVRLDVFGIVDMGSGNHLTRIVNIDGNIPRNEIYFSSDGLVTTDFSIRNHNDDFDILNFNEGTGIKLKGNTGNVGIGTTSPQAKLHVNGDIRGKLQYTGEYTWSRGQASVQMIHKNQGFCFLTRVQGDFAGTNEIARVYISGNYWYLSGAGDDYVYAKARCAGVN